MSRATLYFLCRIFQSILKKVTTRILLITRDIRKKDKKFEACEIYIPYRYFIVLFSMKVRMRKSIDQDLIMNKKIK